uniref:Lipocalin/cytosolic fatty-acid binding domain-containing protein n=1 Tax=Gopherus agassizii TaxID=38772 RepID=A0A452HDR9_9SAUR
MSPLPRPIHPNPLSPRAQLRGTHEPNTHFSGKWFLVGVASKCDYLREYNHQLEATTMAVSASEGKSLAISTFRKLDGVCWEIKQQYRSTKAQGRFLLKSRGSNMDVVVGETDYSSYAILYYQKLRKISIKLFGRSVRVSDAIVGKFEQRITEMNMSEDFTYYFPTYGKSWLSHCSV